MESRKHIRGRPRGTGKNDVPYLSQVADLLVANPKLTATAAMKKVIAKHLPSEWNASDSTLIRRWQIKWKVKGIQFMNEARERASSMLSASSLSSDMKISVDVEAISKLHNMLGKVTFGFGSFADRFQREVEQISRQPGFVRFIENAQVMQEQISRIMQQNDFERAINNAIKIQQQFEQTVRQAAFQRMISLVK